MGSIFITYGAKAGSETILQRTRTSYSYNQRQRQNSSGVTYGQLQQRNGSGYTYNVNGCEWVVTNQEPLYSGPGTDYAYTTVCDGVYPYCDRFYWTSRASACNSRGSGGVNSCYNGASRWYYSYGTYVQCNNCCFYYQEEARTYSYTECAVSWGSWFNVSSCSAASPGCSNGAAYRQCQTVTLCYWNVTAPWYDVASCSVSTPSCTNGASRIECRDVVRYDWNAWSEWTEVQECTPRTDALGANATQIECQIA